MSGSTHSADTSTGGGWIDMSRGAMQQALEALGQFIEKELTVGQRYTNEGSRLLEAHAALHAALAEQAQPVAWMCTETKVLYDHDTSEVDKYHGFKPTVPLYIAAPAPVAPQPLTDADIEALHKDATGYGLSPLGDERKFARAVEAAVLERMGVKR